ncbi:MAG TPA: FtsX-like permease family protein, partial [Patescibacteria group bacterium]|nr:FtsX-like permease family protein [Patescibacteria group bacterium]
ITQSTVTASVVAAGLCIAVLTLPSLIGEASPAGIRAALGRQVGRTMAQRLGIDLALVVLAIVALWQLRLYGAPLTRNARGVLGVDPLLVAAPAIGLLAGAVLATRIVPRLAEIGERLLARRSGVVPPLGARQVARRPLRYTRSALLLVLAAALGTFAAASAATWARSQVDQAAYRAAGDVRVVLSDYPDLPGWAVGSAYRAVPGVTAATPVSSQSLDIGRTVRDGRLVGLDPGAIEMIVRSSGAGTTPADLAALAAARPVTAAVGLDGRPRRLAVTIDAGLEVNTAGSGDTQAPPDWKAVAAAVVLRDGDGRIHRLDVGETALAATGERIVLDLGTVIDDLPVEPTAPLRLESVELTITPPPGLVIDGTVELGGLAVSPTDAGDDWTPVALDPSAAGWLWTRTGPEGTTVYRPPADAPGRIEIGRGDDASPALFGSFDQPGATYRLAASPTGDGIVPVIAGERLLALTGAHVGDTIRVSSAGQDLTVRIVASAAAFPPLDPNEPFLIADGTTLDLVRFAANGYPAAATEWLLAADDRQADAIATTLAGRPYSASQVILRTELAHALAADPIWLGIVGALALGALAAVVFAAIGFVVGATVSTSERLGELALLRALGLSGRQLAAWLTLEQVFLLTVGLVGGSLLGALLAWLVLPYSTLDVTGAAVVPTPVIVVPWEAILPVYFVLAVVLLGTVSILARQVPERRMSRVLRAGET